MSNRISDKMAKAFERFDADQETFRKETEGDNTVEKQWGGARPGAGRRPADPEDKRVQMVITIDRDTRDKLKARAKEQHVRVGRLIDEWVNETFYI